MLFAHIQRSRAMDGCIICITFDAYFFCSICVVGMLYLRECAIHGWLLYTVQYTVQAMIVIAKRFAL